MVNNIYVDKKNVYFSLTENESTLKVRVFSPATKEVKLLGEYEAIKESDGKFSIDRFTTGRDGAFLKYETDLGGVKFPSHVESKSYDEFPNPGTIKGLQVSDPDDAKILGVKHTAINIAITDILRPAKTSDTEEFIFDGKTYYINMKMINHMDRIFKRFTDDGVLVYLILLSGKHWRLDVAPEMRNILLHPDYNDEGTLSAFNVVDDIGVSHYEAFCSFIAKRWAVKDGSHGRVYGAIVSNEVTSQWIWGNEGLKTCREFCEDYTEALRIAYIAGTLEYSDFRVYVSMDHFWGKAMDPNEPLKYYPGKELLKNIGDIAKRDGDFYWNIAHHPYPEDLTKPDFWNDQTATDEDDTHRITFKNLQVLARFLYKEENLFEGKRRRVILSEQGFNSKWTPESEILQATAYGRAYRKVMEIPEIDAFILHAHLDNIYEGGLNLGLWRRKEESNELDRPKPCYYLFKVIDQKDDTGKFVYERF